MIEPIVTIEKKADESFLRTKTIPFDFAKFKKKELQDLVRSMRMTMKKADGVGLSANQIGRKERFFVAQVPDSQNRPVFYAIFNPQITKMSEELATTEEGCLSVPYAYGQTPRAYRVTLEGYDINNKKVKIKAWGLLARVFQHETDHLDGKLFVDRANKVVKVPQPPAK